MNGIILNMTPAVSTPATKARPGFKIRSIALPNEHGSWGILFEPLVLGIAVAPSLASPFVAMLYVGAFLSRQPLKIYLADLRAGRDRAQTGVAKSLAFAYLSLATIGFFGSLAFAGVLPLLPLILTAPLGFITLWFDVSGKSRRVAPEMAGVVTLASSAAVCGLAAGWTVAGSVALSIIIILRLIPSMLYIRERLKLEKGKDSSFAVPLALHVFAVLALASLAWFSLSPWLPLAVFTFLMMRALTGSSDFRLKLKAKQLGMLEVLFGTLVVLSIIVGHYTHI
ncbi:MAG: YwiC-like family protein [Acidobacteria bacterium]|nr:YwiC-like family protein [Acidobacteriota bacterium]